MGQNGMEEKRSEIVEGASVWATKLSMASCTTRTCRASQGTTAHIEGTMNYELCVFYIWTRRIP